MRPEVDPGQGRCEQRADAGPNRLRVADEGQDAAVVGPVGRDVEQAQARNAPDGGSDLLHGDPISSLRDVGDALDDRSHLGSS